MAVTPIRALMHQAQSRPESAAFIFRGDVWTYRRLALVTTGISKVLDFKGLVSA